MRIIQFQICFSLHWKEWQIEMSLLLELGKDLPEKKWMFLGKELTRIGLTDNHKLLPANCSFNF